MRGAAINKDHPQADKGQGYKEACTDGLTQDQGTAQEYTKYRSKEGKGVEETHRITMYEFKPEEVAQEGYDDTLVEDRETCSGRKTGYKSVFHQCTEQEQ